MKKENTVAIENEVEEIVEVQEMEEVMPKKGFFTKIGEGIDSGIKKVAPVGKKIVKGAALVGAGVVVAAAAGKKLGKGKTNESVDCDDVEAEEYDVEYTQADEYAE